MNDSGPILRIADLEGEGISRRQRRRMVANGELRVAGRGLFVTQAGGGWHHQVAAAWARRPEGAICGEAAAALYGLDGFDPGVSIETQIDPRVSHAQPGVRRHRLLQDSVDFDGIHVTAIEETLLGLGARLRPRPGCAAARQHLESIDLVELATECALHLGLTTVDSLTELLVRAPRNRPGRGVLALVLRQRPPGAPPTESYLETRCVQVLRAAALPDFQRQIELDDVDGRIGRVDFIRGRVVIETLGKDAHAKELDKNSRRIARLAAAGYEPLPFTFAHVEFDQELVVRTTAAALRRQANL